MAQANPAREPSMEEILASIRRIIEGDEEAAEAAAGHEADAAPQDRADEPEGPPFRGANTDEPEPAPAMRQQPDADLDAAVADDAPAPGKEPEAAGDEMKTQPSYEEPAFAPAEQPAVSEDAAAAAGRRARGEGAGAESRPGSTQERAPARPGEPSGARSSQLLSAASEARVTAAFDALAAAVLARKMPPPGEMAEAILRPMLRQWMDENLPALVERLVREEIARIAEGEPDTGGTPEEA